MKNMKSLELNLLTNHGSTNGQANTKAMRSKNMSQLYIGVKIARGLHNI